MFINPSVQVLGNSYWLCLKRSEVNKSEPLVHPCSTEHTADICIKLPLHNLFFHHNVKTPRFLDSLCLQLKSLLVHNNYETNRKQIVFLPHFIYYLFQSDPLYQLIPVGPLWAKSSFIFASKTFRFWEVLDNKTHHTSLSTVGLTGSNTFMPIVPKLLNLLFSTICHCRIFMHILLV